MARRMRGWVVSAMLALLAPLGAQSPDPAPRRAVFTVVFEVAASSSSGTSASSRVEVGFAPGLEWRGTFGTNFGGVDLRTPQKLFRVRGGLYGLHPGESMCFGILRHKGSASAGGRTLGGPGSIQLGGDAWSLREDAARFVRTEEGGELRVAPVVYQDDEPTEFGLLTVGGYDGGPAGATRFERLQVFRFTNEELRNLARVQKVNQASLHDPIAGATQVYKSSFSGGEPEDETEVSVEPEGYDDWIPEGDLDTPGEDAKRLRIKLTAHKKGDPSVKRKAHLVLSLKEVTMEKGVCLNWPVAGAKSDYDLKILPKENPELEVLGPDQAKTREAVEALELVITAQDFGAWGILHIEAKDGAGNEAKVRVRSEDKADLLIPKDENRNHIADAWELKWGGGLRGQETEDEEDVPVGKPGCTGDGLTRYEEYRGFRITGGAEPDGVSELITGKHVRTDPRVKDLFVCDQTSGRIGGPGIAHFGKATGLRVHRLDPTEIGQDRVVNANGGFAHSVPQHGLILADGPKGSDPEQIAVNAASAFGPPALTLRISLPVGASFATRDGLADVAHEICHGVGLCHHGDGEDYPAEWYWQLGPEGEWQLFEQRIASVEVQTALDKTTSTWVPDPKHPAIPIQAYWEPKGGSGTPRPFRKEDGPPEGSSTVGVDRWRLWVGVEGGMWSGDQECLMRYYDKQSYRSKAEPGRVRYLPDKSQWKMRVRLCDKKEGTGVNANGHRPQPRYGDATVGDCKHQLVVNDKYAGK